MRNLGDEVPYALTVEIEKFTLEGGVLHIYGLIWVERPGQKRIIIGTAGEQLKRVGAQARQDFAGDRLNLSISLREFPGAPRLLFSSNRSPVISRPDPEIART